VSSATIRRAEVEGRADYSRQRGYFDPARHGGRVTLIGAGGIGSPTGLALAKLGVPEIDVIDFDTVEVHNLPNQMFDAAMIGESKAWALAEAMRSYAPTVEATAYHGKATAGGIYVADEDAADGVKQILPRGIVVSALDSMEARAHLWEAVKDEAYLDLLIDARLGGEAIVVYAVNPHRDAEFYEETLHSDEDGVELPCSRRQVIDVGFAVAALITRAVRRHLTGAQVERMVYLNQDTLGLHRDNTNNEEESNGSGENRE
jgi:molybdopterin-synthase adenylyltransferase